MKSSARWVGMGLLSICAAVSWTPAAVWAQETADTISAAPLEQKSIADLIEDLRGNDVQAKRDAAWDLGSFGREAVAAVEALMEAADVDDPQIANGAIRALGEIGADARPALPVLMAQMNHNNAQRRYRAAVAFGRIVSADDPHVAQGLSSSSERVRLSMLASIGWMGPRAQPLLPKLIEYLTSDDAAVGNQVVESLVGLGALSVDPLVDFLTNGARLDADAAAFRRGQQRALAVFAQLPELPPTIAATIDAVLEQPDPELQAAAIRVLGRFAAQDAQAAQRVATGLSAEEVVVQTAALAVAIEHPSVAEQNLTALIQLLDQPDQRAPMAAMAIGRAGKLAAPAIPDLLTRSNDNNRAAIIECIGRMGEPAVAFVLESCENETLTPDGAAEILAQIGLPAEPALRVALNSPRPTDRNAAARALGRLRKAGPEIAARLQDMEPSVQQAAAIGLRSFGEEASFAREGLRAALDAADPQLRLECLATLVATGAPVEDLLEPLVESLSDAQPTVRRQAASTLGTLAELPDAATHKLVAALRDTDGDVRHAAAVAIARHPQAVAAQIPTLLSVVDSAETQVLIPLASVLAAITPVEDQTLTALSNLLDHEAPEVRVAALEALAKLGPAAGAVRSRIEARLTDSQAAIRLAALTSLAAIAPEVEARRALLIQNLGDQDWTVRKKATELLADMGGDAVPAVPRLLEMLHSAEDAEAVNSALRRIDAAPPEAIPQLLQILRDPQGDRRQRFFALYLLRKVGPAAKEALPVLEELRQGAEGRLREFLDRAVSDISGQ